MKRYAALVALLALMCLCCQVDAQSTNATLSGLVVDTSGKVIVDAAVTIVSDATGIRYTRSTNRSGIYTVSILPPGQYRVEVSKAGFKTLIKPGIVLNVQSALALNFTLPVGATSESVTIDAGALSMNTTDGSVSTVIDRQFVENMPLNGRSFQDLLTLAPGVSLVPTPVGVGAGTGYSGDIVVNGQRTESSYFTVDGVSANIGAITAGPMSAGISGSLPVFTALGTTQGLASVDALQEFRSNTSTYSAEYGRSPGGQFAFSTRAGTDKMHGSLFEYLRNDLFDSNNWFNNYYADPKGKERQNDFGGTLGGPLGLGGKLKALRDTFYFFSYEGLRLRSPQAAALVEVPDENLREQAPSDLLPALNAFPHMNAGEDGVADGFGYFLESVSYPAELNSTSLRVDRSVGGRWTIFGRYAETPSNSSTYTAAVRNRADSRTKSLTAGTTWAASSRQSNELRFNFTRSASNQTSVSTDLGGATPLNLGSLPGPNDEPFPSVDSQLYVVFDYANYTAISLGTAPLSQDQINLTDSHEWSLGRHVLKIGVDWRRLLTLLPITSISAEIAYDSQDQVLQNTPDFAYAASNGLAGDNEPLYMNFSAYFQDQWKALPHLSVSAGMRWDVNPAPTNANGPVPYTVTQIDDLISTMLAPQGTRLWSTQWTGFAPRLGAAYRLHDGSTWNTVLRAGFGVFYDTGNSEGSQGYSGIGFSSTTYPENPKFPLTSDQLALPVPSVEPPYSDYIFASDPNLRLPYTLQYNFAVEQGFGRHDSITVGYVGSGARHLLTTFLSFPGLSGNPNFSPSGGLEITSGRASSNYNSLQVKYQRDLSRGLQAIASYTLSHSIDSASSNFTVFLLQRANSDFDIRHNLQAAMTYTTPRLGRPGMLEKLSEGWGLDIRLTSRSALPVDVIGGVTIDPVTGAYARYQPNRVAGEPVYLYGDQYPGGRILNYNAFSAAPSGTEGNVPRNLARGFSMAQFDAAIRRDIPVGEKVRFQLRAEGFNVINHPMFGPIRNWLTYGATMFGYAYNTANVTGNLNSLYQAGGPRSLQFALKLVF